MCLCVYNVYFLHYCITNTNTMPFGTVVCWFVVPLRPHTCHMKVPRQGVKLELQLLAYTTVTAMPDPSSHLHHSSWQRQILNPPSEARDQTESSWILVRFITTEPQRELLNSCFLNEEMNEFAMLKNRVCFPGRSNYTMRNPWKRTFKFESLRNTAYL